MLRRRLPLPSRCGRRDCAWAQGCYQRSRGPHPRSLLAPRLTSFALRSGSGLLSALAGTPPPLAARSATHFVRAALGLRAVISARGDPTPARCSLRDSLRSRCARAQGCYQRSRGPHPRSLLAPRLTRLRVRADDPPLAARSATAQTVADPTRPLRDDHSSWRGRSWVSGFSLRDSLRSRCARAQGCYQRSRGPHPRSLLAPRLTSFALRSGSGLLSALAGTPPPLAARSATHFVRAALGLRAVISARGDPTPARCSLRDSLRSRCAGCW